MSRLIKFIEYVSNYDELYLDVADSADVDVSAADTECNVIQHKEVWTDIKDKFPDIGKEMTIKLCKRTTVM